MILRFLVNQNLSEVVYLNQGKYHVFFSGGYRLSHENEISFQLTDQITSEQQKVTSTSRIRCNIEGSKSVKLFQFELVKNGNYIIRLNGITGLKMKKSRLFLINMFYSQSSGHESQIELIITNEY